MSDIKFMMVDSTFNVDSKIKTSVCIATKGEGTDRIYLLYRNEIWVETHMYELNLKFFSNSGKLLSFYKEENHGSGGSSCGFISDEGMYTKVESLIEHIFEPKLTRTHNLEFSHLLEIFKDHLLSNPSKEENEMLGTKNFIGDLIMKWED